MKQPCLHQIIGIAFLGAASLISLSLLSFESADLRFFAWPASFPLHNLIGPTGAYLAGGALFCFGWGGWIIVGVLVGRGLFHLFKREYAMGLGMRLGAEGVLLLSVSSLMSISGVMLGGMRFNRGGVLGLILSDLLVRYCGRTGASIIFAVIILLSLLVVTDLLFLHSIGRAIKFVFGKLSEFLSFISAKRREKTAIIKKPAPAPLPLKEPPQARLESREEIPKKSPKAEKISAAVKSPQRKIGDYRLPSLELLSLPAAQAGDTEEDLTKNAEILEETLRHFGIEVKVTDMEQGPVVTRYEMQPAAGVKVHRITELSDDIALAMKAHSVRILAPIPGKSRVGVEVPNAVMSKVVLREVMESAEYRKQGSSPLMLALGKDVSGKSVAVNLTECPHLLIAGTTGSGKTVCVNTMIMSVLFNAGPDDVKFLMIDPKMVELAVYNGLPHLLSPVVTDAKKVSGALEWVVGEMERRYKVFAGIGVRNIEVYNSGNGKRGDAQKMSYIVVIIDELADLMMVASDKIEIAITRLAQLSRAVGIHIVLATQRPSVDVITGVIKANFPARIAFQVASKVDSRTVLDMNGADKLLGRGDMLFLPAGTSKPIRVQGCLIQDKEIERVVEFIKSQKSPSYEEGIMESLDGNTQKISSAAADELFDEAVKVVLESKNASVSMIQRRMRLGYTRAARLIDMMEDRGIVGPYRGSKPRELLGDNKDNDK